MKVILPLIPAFKQKGLRNLIGISYLTKNYKGTVKFTEKSICVNFKRNTIHYYIEDLESLKIEGGLYQAYSPLEYVLDNAGFSRVRHTGKTKFTLSFKDKEIVINFQIRSKKEFDAITTVLTHWYNSKLFKIKEYHLGIDRMLLLDPYKNYEQIQVVKKKLDIKSMYE